MKTAIGHTLIRIGTVATWVVAVLLACPTLAQYARLSLADRVSRLEQQLQQQNQSSADRLNRMQQLQWQVQQMQGQIEDLQHQLRAFQTSQKTHDADLDVHLGQMQSKLAAIISAVKPAAGTVVTERLVKSVKPQHLASAGTNAQTPAKQKVKKESTRPATKKKVTSANDTMRAAYDAAFKSLRDGDYVAASRGFRGYIEKYPHTALTPNALYWLGESYYVTQNYQVALEAFKQLLTSFPDSAKAPGALLKLGYTQLEMRQTAVGKATLKTVLSRYPSSHVATLARGRLRRLNQVH